MKAIILGAGVVGVTSAYFLKKESWDVTVIDRQACAAMETSFANGGQISASHAEPWANPHVLPNIAKWLFKKDAPLLWHFRANFAQWQWALQFLWQCQAAKTRQNIAAIVNLALFSRKTLQELRKTENLEYAQKNRGILHLYSDEKNFKNAANAVRWMQEFGLDRKMISKDEAISIEPALTESAHRLVGADYTATDESGDAHLFTQKLSEKCENLGVQFLYNTTAQRLVVNAHGQIAGVVVQRPPSESQSPELLTADAYIVALGSFSAPFLKPLGLHLPIQPAKGYSITLQLTEKSVAPNVSLTDDAQKLVFSRLGERLRVAGTAEFAGFDLTMNEVRAQNILAQTQKWFPQLNFTGDANFWCGLRPATPSNCPIIGKVSRTRLNALGKMGAPLAKTGFENLWLNTGHGTLGWTLSAGSAKLLSQMIAGKPLKGIFAHRIYPFLEA